MQLFQTHTYVAVLFDKELPDGDGAEICRWMRCYEKEQSLPPVPLIAVTSDKTSKNAFLLAGCNDFMTKPISPEQLKKVFKKWIPTARRHKKNVSLDSIFNLIKTNFINQQKECTTHVNSY